MARFFHHQTNQFFEYDIQQRIRKLRLAIISFQLLNHEVLVFDTQWFKTVIKKCFFFDLLTFYQRRSKVNDTKTLKVVYQANQKEKLLGIFFLKGFTAKKIP